MTMTALDRPDAIRRVNMALAKISPWFVYGIGFLPALWYFWLGADNRLGANPIQTFEHLLGEWTLRFLMATLLVTPLRDLTRISLLRFRRALGLMTFYYALMHFTVYFTLDKDMDLGVIVNDIVKRPYITIGMGALLGLVALAVTSNAFSIRRLGRGWNRLHSLVYVIAALGVTHYIMSVKSWPPRPLIYAALIAILIGYRFVKPVLRQRRVAA